MTQSGDLPIIEIWREDKIQDERNRAQATGRSGKPRSACPEVSPHEGNY
jgi:hypothetical protein